MFRKLKGGIENIIAIIIVVGIVIALIIATILPTVNKTEELGDAGTGRIEVLRDIVAGEEDV